MTNTEHTDIRPLFSTAASTAAKVLAGVTPAQYGDPTPCDDFTVRQLMDHLVGATRRLAVVGRGGDAESVDPSSPLEEWNLAFSEAVSDVEEAWGDPARLGQTVVLPFAELPGAAAVALYTNEVTVHSWDLAGATGQSVDWDPAVLAVSLSAMKQMLPPGARPEEIPFADEVAVPGDAPAIDQLVAWSGRRP